MEEMKKNSYTEIKEHEKSNKSIILFQLITSVFIIILLIVLKILTPEIYNIIDAWLLEKLNNLPFLF